MERTQYTCDVCGTEKKETNHWWLFVVNDDGFQLAPWGTPWYQTRQRPQATIQHLCGQACAIRKLSEFMSPPPPPNRQEPSTEARIQQQENEEPAQPQWTPEGPISFEKEHSQ
jgi:hypothetical protein